MRYKFVITTAFGILIGAATLGAQEQVPAARGEARGRTPCVGSDGGIFQCPPAPQVDRRPRRPPVRQQDRPDADETGGDSFGRAHHRGRTGGPSQDSGGSASDRPQPGDRAARPDRRAHAHVQHAQATRDRRKPPC